jgi:DNA-binding SARP family transcriptional activator
LWGPCPEFGKTLAPARIYLTGRISIENGDTVLEERDLAGRQGRLAFAFLAAERHRPVSRDHFVSVVWPDGPPRELDASLSAILSKLRSALKKAGLPKTASVDVLSGAVQLRLPADVWIDLEAAAHAIDVADGALRGGELVTAWGHAGGAVSIARRPFLAGEEAPWVETRRARLRAVLVRGLSVLSRISAINREDALAVQYASEIIELEPFQETAYRHLMRLHAQMGNRGEALRVFGKCRELLRDELGADPSPETEAAFLEILRAGAQ